MNTKSYLVWVEFYTKFADRLLDYKKDRKTLISKIQAVYQTIGIKVPKLDNGTSVSDMDPFTVFGLFNKGITDANRILILRGIAKEFHVEAEVPNSFEGIPVLNNLNATFYRFSDDPERGELDIDNLWKVFEDAIVYANSETIDNRNAFIEAYDIVKDLKGNRWKLTMGLYWIRPYKYINLDSRNRWYLENPQNMPSNCIEMIKGLNNIPSGANYSEICDAFSAALKEGAYGYHNFPELSFYAWTISEKVNQEKRAESEQSKRGKAGAALADENVDVVHYWLYSPGDSAVMWDEFYRKGIMAIGWGEIGDLRTYENKEAMKLKMKESFDPSRSYKNSAHATWQFAFEMKPGDIVFVKKGMHQLVGRGVVSSDYEFDGDRPDEYKNVRKVNWTHHGEWPHPGQTAMKTLTDITFYTDYVEKLNMLFKSDLEDDDDGNSKTYPPYSMDDFLNEVFIDENEYNILLSLLHNKMNIILQGPPGVGKTYAAKRLAYSIMGVKDKDRVMMIQFHQSYSYEDFIIGFRPSENGFELRKGAFYNFCKKAEIDSDNEYFFIIDEINRGNLSRIFGELFMLIEADKRGIELQLLYSDEKFAVPENVYIIGMMNTADRSLAILDYALRRRFAFYELKPGFESEGFRAYRTELDNPKFDRLIHCVEDLNTVIAADESLGEGFRIGHSYFCGLNSDDNIPLSSIVEYEIIPLLKEYWFDEPSKIKDWSNNLRGVIK